MKRTKFYKASDGIYNSAGEIKEEILQEIISVAYNDASFFQKRGVERLTAEYPEVKKILEEYRQTAKSVRSLDVDNCPEEIVQIVQIRTGNDKKQSQSFFFDLYSFIFSKPIVSFSATAVILAVLVVSIFIEREPVEPRFTEAEIELANKQAKETLVLVSNIFNKTKNSIKSEIITKHVVEPINKGVDQINDLFSEGGENESIN